MDHLPEKRDVYSFPEQFALEIAKSQFGAPTLGVIFALAFQVAGIAALLGWTADMDKKTDNKLTGLQKILLIVSPPLGILWLTQSEASAIEEDLAKAALAPAKLLLAPVTFWAKKAGL